MLYEFSSDESMVETRSTDEHNSRSSDASDSGSSSDDRDSSSDDSDADSSSDDSDSNSSDESSDNVLTASIHQSEVPQPIDESSLLDDVPEVSVHMTEETTYELVQKSSQRQKDKLMDSGGYTYNLHKKIYISVP